MVNIHTFFSNRHITFGTFDHVSSTVECMHSVIGHRNVFFAKKKNLSLVFYLLIGLWYKRYNIKQTRVRGEIHFGPTFYLIHINNVLEAGRIIFVYVGESMYSVLFNKRTGTAIFLGEKIRGLRPYLKGVRLTKFQWWYDFWKSDFFFFFIFQANSYLLTRLSSFYSKQNI